MNNSMKTTWMKASLSKVKHARLSILSTLFAALLGLSANGQKLEDFKRCAASTSIATLPYQKIKRDAERWEADKKRAFNETNGYGFDKMEDEKDAILRKIKAEKRKLEEAEDDLEDDKRRAPEVSSPHEREVKESKEKLEDLNEDLEEMNDKIDVAIAKFETLQEARKKVREAFEDVNDELYNSLNRPHVHIGPKPSSSDREALDKWNEKYKQLKEYIEDIGDVIDDKARTHKEQEDGAGNVVKKLKALKAKSSI